MDKTTIARITSGVVGLGLVALGAWLTSQADGDHAGMLIMAGLAVIGGGLGTSLLPSTLGPKPPSDPGAEARAKRRARRGGPPGPTMMLLALALALTASGCGATLDPVYAGIGQGALDLAVEAEPAIRASRSAAMRAAGDRVHGAGGTLEEARAAVDAEAAAWQCAVDGHRIFSSATSAYVDGLLLAAGTGELDLPTVLRFASHLVDAWRALASCVGSRGGTLPVPSFLDLFPPAWGLLTETTDAAE